eukprot:gene47222-57439_t
MRPVAMGLCWWTAKFPGDAGDVILTQSTGFTKQMCRRIQNEYPLNNAEEVFQCLNYVKVGNQQTDAACCLAWGWTSPAKAPFSSGQSVARF